MINDSSSEVTSATDHYDLDPLHSLASLDWLPGFLLKNHLRQWLFSVGSQNDSSSRRLGMAISIAMGVHPSIPKATTNIVEVHHEKVHPTFLLLLIVSCGAVILYRNSQILTIDDHSSYAQMVRHTPNHQKFGPFSCETISLGVTHDDSIYGHTLGIHCQ